jgi:hypothetical protein
MKLPFICIIFHPSFRMTRKNLSAEHEVTRTSLLLYLLPSYHQFANGNLAHLLRDIKISQLHVKLAFYHYLSQVSYNVTLHKLHGL